MGVIQQRIGVVGLRRAWAIAEGQIQITELGDVRADVGPEHGDLGDLVRLGGVAP